MIYSTIYPIFKVENYTKNCENLHQYLMELRLLFTTLLVSERDEQDIQKSILIRVSLRTCQSKSEKQFGGF